MSHGVVPAACFAAFADLDLVRWRALRGRTVTPASPAWGEGRVGEVRWEGRSDLPDDRGAVYLRVEYADGLRVRVNARAFARLHASAAVDPELAAFIVRWFGDPSLGDDEGTRDAALAHCDAQLRAEQDAAREEHVAELRRRASDRAGRS